MRKILNVIYITAFLLALIVPACRINTQKNVVSDFDNRELVEFPEVGQDGYEGKVEEYLRDRIGFRDQLVTGYQKINDIFAGELTHPLYTYGRDGYMFFNMHYNVNYSSYHSLFVSAVVKMKDYCEVRGIPFYFVFDPEKISVYRQYLPAGVMYNDEWVTELLNNLREQGVTVVDNHEMLARISAREQVFNRQYDAGHWNDLGAFYATNNLWTTVHEDFPSVKAYSPDDFTITTTVAEYLPSSKFSVDEEVPSYKINTPFRDETEEYAAIKHDTRYPFFRYYINTSEKAVTYPKMLVFHGSYYNRCPEFFIGRASEYMGIHNYQNVLDLDYYVTLFQPEMVVFEVAEYTLEERYFSSQLMATMDFNPGLTEETKELVQAQFEETSGAASGNVFVVSNPDFDEIYFEQELPYAKYVYLMVDDKVYDLQDVGGIRCADVMHDTVSGSGFICYEDYSGEIISFPVSIRGVEKFEHSGLSVSAGVSSEKDGKRYTFTTAEEDNVFDAVDLQLLDYVTGEYLEGLDHVAGVGARDISFVHKRKSGWYRIRLKANSTLKDEYVDILVLLTQGRKYRSRYTVTALTPGTISIDDYELFGGGRWTLERQELMTEPQHTEGIEFKAGEWRITTSVPDNRFGAVVLNLIDAVTGEQIGPIGIADSAGGREGRYYHRAKTGTYYIKLRGDTNLADEYIITSAVLQEGMLYDWSFDVLAISPEEIRVRDISFEAWGKEIE